MHRGCSDKDQPFTLMKDNSIAMRQNSRLVSAALGVLLLAGTACNRVTINIGSLPAGLQTASLAGPPAGGNFVPVQAIVAPGGSTTVCNQQVSGTFVRFYPPKQTPPAGYGRFQGYLRNVNTGAIVPSSNYYLQWFVTSANYGCCTSVSSTEVRCSVTPGLAYCFTAHFKVGAVPPSETPIQLIGAWTLSEIDE